jgi:hypothetical protein
MLQLVTPKFFTPEGNIDLTLLTTSLKTRYTIGTGLFTINHLQQRMIQRTMISNFNPINLEVFMIAFLIVVFFGSYIQDPIKQILDNSMKTAELINEVYKMKGK